MAYETEDSVTARQLIGEYKPEDYIAAFERFVAENTDRIDAIGVLLNRPWDWSTDALAELRQRLAAAPEHFNRENLEQAHRLHYNKALVDIVSMIKHAADAEEPLFSAAERVDRAVDRATFRLSLSAEQKRWLERIRKHLVENLSIERVDFEGVQVFARSGGWGRANRAFNGQLEELVRKLNAEVAA